MWIFSQSNLTGLLAQWLEVLADFQIQDIVHVRGENIIVADALSCRPDCQEPELAMLLAIPQIVAECSDITTPVSDTFAELVAKQHKDPTCVKLWHNLEHDVLPATDPTLEHVVGGVLMWDTCGRYRVVVPPKLRKLLLAEAHGTRVSGCMWADKTSAESCYWLNMHGSQFTGEFFREVLRLCGMRQVLGTADHPQSQGLTEHANRTGIEGIRHDLEGLHEEWDEHIVPVELTYNYSVTPSLGATPLETLYGFNPRPPLDLAAQSAAAVSELMPKLQGKIDSAPLFWPQLKQAEAASL